MVMEKIIALGAERICLFGWCGSLQPDVEIGDLVIPLHAIARRDLQALPYRKEKPSTDPGLNRILERALEQEGLPFRKGTVWTTDAPYRETASKVKHTGIRESWLCEMEMSALMTLAAYRSVKLSGLLVVSDELFDLKWHRGFSSPVFKNDASWLGTCSWICSRKKIVKGESGLDLLHRTWNVFQIRNRSTKLETKPNVPNSNDQNNCATLVFRSEH